MSKELSREFEKRATYSRHAILKFFKEKTKDEFANDETWIKVKKGDEHSFNDKNTASAPYTIEIERPIGTNISKDKSFESYLKSIFGSKQVEYSAFRLGNPQREKAVFNIIGDDAILSERIAHHIEQKVRKNRARKLTVA